MALFRRQTKPARPGSKASGPDACTREAWARVRAVPDVAAAEIVDGDTLSVTWHDGTAGPVVLTTIRDRWSQAKGFDRIEIMDDFVAGLAPPRRAGNDLAAPLAPVDAAGDGSLVSVPASPDGAPPADGPSTAWSDVRSRLRPVVRRCGPVDDDVIRWSVGGVVEATVTLDGSPLPVSAADAVAWGVDHTAVRSAAEAALAAIDPALDALAGGGAWVPATPAGELASWLTSPARLLDAAGVTEAVVVAPQPGELVIVDASMTDVVASILASTHTIVAEGACTLWPTPFLVTATAVEPWRAPAGHPCAEHLEALGAFVTA